MTTHLQEMLDTLDKMAAGENPGQVGGKSTHPVTNEDNGAGAVYTGARFDENTKDVKDDPTTGGSSVEEESPIPSLEEQARKNTAGDNPPKTTGNDPSTETASAKDTPLTGQIGGKSTHPATTDKQGSGPIAEIRQMVRQFTESSDKVATMIAKEAGLVPTKEGETKQASGETDKEEVTAQEVASVDEYDVQAVKQATYDIIEAVRSQATQDAIKTAHFLHGMEQARQEEAAKKQAEAEAAARASAPGKSQGSSLPNAKAGKMPAKAAAQDEAEELPEEVPASGEEALEAGDGMEIPGEAEEAMLGGPPADMGDEGLAELVAELMGSGEIDPAVLIELLGALEGGGGGDMGGGMPMPEEPPMDPMMDPAAGMDPAAMGLPPEAMDPAMLAGDPKLAQQVRIKVAQSMIRHIQKSATRKTAKKAAAHNPQAKQTKKESAVTSRITEIINRSRR